LSAVAETLPLPKPETPTRRIAREFFALPEAERRALAIANSPHFRGYTVRDVETLFEKRLAGESFMARFPLQVVSGVFVDLAKALVEFRIVRKRENTIADF